MQYSTPTIIQESTATLVLALSETEVGKVCLPQKWQWVDTQTGKPVDFLNNSPKFEDEVQALQYANKINGLMPKFIRKDTWKIETGENCDMIVMERLFPLPIHHFPLATREKMMARFEEELKQLHDELFVHSDFMRPTNYYTRGNREWMFQNIVQTEQGLRLIDAGFGIICQKENLKTFVGIMLREQGEVGYFKNYYLE